MSSPAYAILLELAAGAVLVCAVVTLWRRSLDAIVKVLAVQGVALGAVALVLGIRQQDGVLVAVACLVVAAPDRAAERGAERRLRSLGEQGEVDLVGVLVLDDAPGVLARVQQAGIEVDRSRDRVVNGDRRDLDRDLLRDEAPVERACVQRVLHRLLLGRRAALEDVVAAAGMGDAGEGEEGGKHCNKNGCLADARHDLICKRGPRQVKSPKTICRRLISVPLNSPLSGRDTR